MIKNRADFFLLECLAADNGIVIGYATFDQMIVRCQMAVDETNGTTLVVKTNGNSTFIALEITY